MFGSEMSMCVTLLKKKEMVVKSSYYKYLIA